MKVAVPDRRPRTFSSPREALSDLAGVLRRAPALASVYLRGGLEPELRERVMVAVSRANACGGCTAVHERWALRSGVGPEELEAIGLGDLDRLDERSRAAVVCATAMAQARFRGPLPAGPDGPLSHRDLAAVEAVARAMSLANLSVSSARALLGHPAPVPPPGRPAGPD
ncbi:MAG: carboxymuconolactone decarboxylase family protein [Solirubrobacterales bacterium]